MAHHIIKHGSPRLVIFALIAGLLALAVSAASLTFFLSYRSTATAQIRQLQQAVANAQAGNQANVSGLSSQAAKISAVNAALSSLAAYDQVCSQALVTQTGTGQFYFLCTDVKPGG